MSDTPPLPAADLAWVCPPSTLSFTTTTEVSPAAGIVGQEGAAGALRFGLAVHAQGHNVFVRGRMGTGRRTLVHEILEGVSPTAPPPQDRVFVHGFDDPRSPRLIELPPGHATPLRDRADALVAFIADDLAEHVNNDGLRGRTQALDAEAAQRMTEASAPFEADLAKAGLTLVAVGDGARQIVPLVDGAPMSFDEVSARAEAGDIDPEQISVWRALASDAQRAFQQVSATVVGLRREAQAQIQDLVQAEARRILETTFADLPEAYPTAAGWFAAVVDDVVTHLGQLEASPGAIERYRVQILRTITTSDRPVVVETNPTVQRLLGGVDLPGEGTLAPHLGIHPGALVEADGGTLVLQARDLLAEPGAWPALKRVLRSGRIELSPQEAGATTLRPQHLRPEAIPIEVKVVLIGEADVWATLDQRDPDFPHLFKVLVDLDDLIPRDDTSIALYAQVVSRLADQEELPPFTAGAVGRLVEHGARVGAQGGMLTARFGRIADLVREAAFLARQRGVEEVHRQDVDRTIALGKARADLPGRRFRDRVRGGVIHLETRDTAVGQVNGLAVIQAGPLSYGFPMRITATVGAGEKGTVHLQHEVMLSGQIHTKGFLTIQGLLRRMLSVEHPLVFNASITHEQSYGGIDGDSASGAEFVCLMSALTGLGAHQGLAMTGAIDQHGHVLPVGAVDEKIEGFYDACVVQGLDGAQGVLIPAVCVRNLQLRADIVDACRDGRFAIYAVDGIETALALLLGTPADTVRDLAISRVSTLWQIARGAT